MDETEYTEDEKRVINFFVNECKTEFLEFLKQE